MNQQLSTPSPNLRQDPNNKTYQSRKKVYLDEEDEIPDFLPCDKKYSIDNIYKDLILPQSVLWVWMMISFFVIQKDFDGLFQLIIFFLKHNA
mmetsp:Transcript_41263/g.60355  ORF Transcript_41263/g.60355 Transcript_41263/m.60355 type:complete len:92 (-) Transcript_41263:76-351(-)